MNMTRRFTTCLALLLTVRAFLLPGANVNEYRFHSMPETSYYAGIHSIVKDKIGRIWFSGSDAVYMYDGVAFERQNDKLVSFSPDTWWTFLQVVTAADGCVYVGTNHGLMRYDYETETFKCVLDGNISSVEADLSGTLWLIRNDAVESWTPLGSEPPIQYPFADDMGITPQNLILASSGGQIYVASGNVLYGLSISDGQYVRLAEIGLRSSVVRDVETHEGKCYVLTTKDGVFEYDEKWRQTDHFRLPHEYEMSTVAKMLYLDPQGVLWTATQSGIFLIETQTSRTQMIRSNIHYPYSLPNNSVWSIYPDPDGGVWVGTYGGKLAFMPVSDGGGNWFKPTPGGLNHSIVSCFEEDSMGNLWIGTEGGGVNFWDRKADRYIHYTQENNSGVRSNMIKKLDYDDNGRLYMSSFNGGIQVYDPMTNTFSDVASGNGISPFMVVYDFIKEGKKGYWISDPDSPLRFLDIRNRSVSVNRIRYEGAFLQVRIETMFRRNDGRICLVTSKGLLVVDDDCNVLERKYMHDAPYAKNDLCCFCMASDSILWLGTRGGGVNCLTPDGEYYGFADVDGNSLDGKTVFGILEDSDTGDIWFSTDDGLYYYVKAKGSLLRSSIDAHNLCGAYYVRSCFKTSKGEMLFGGTDGFIIFDPGKIGSNVHKPNPFFVDLKINSSLVRPFTEESPLSRDISTMNDADSDERIRLNYRQSNFEISFSSDSYQDADKTIYAYRMKGLSDTWNVLPQGQRSVAFFDIPPGKYVFELKAANGDGVWGDKVISVGFKVDPSPFLSVWAYIIYAMIAAASALLISLYVKHKRRFKEELDQKNAEISDLYKKKYVAGPSEIVVTSLEDELLKKALGFVEQNMDNSEYGVEDFVSDMALGRTVLYQKINAITGLSIKEFILDIRIKRAARLLAESDKTISEISYMTGFVNPKYFSTIFRKHFGQTPSEYRKKTI